MKQVSMYQDGKLKSFIDKGDKSTTGPFVGLEKIVDAVEVNVFFKFKKQKLSE